MAPRLIRAGVGAPTLGGTALNVLSQSSGSLLLDAGLGGAVGYAIAPEDSQEFRYAAYGALASGLAGMLGVLALVGYRYWRR